MSGIAEISIAVQFAEEISASGSCTHAAYRIQPMSLSSHEAAEIERFDPDLFELLSASGVTVEKPTIEDFEEIGDRIEDIKAAVGYDAQSNSKKLYKHAAALRLQKTLVSLTNCSEHHDIIRLSRIFGHRRQSF